jgi:T5SS/PEP-CTERM-associated repeat protein
MSRACALAGIVVCAFGATPPRAAADAAVTSAVGQVAKLTSQSGVLFSNPVTHTKLDTRNGPTSANVTNYAEEVTSHVDDPGGPSVLSSTGGNINDPNVIIGEMNSDSSVRQSTNVTSTANSVDVDSSATAVVRKTSVVGNCCFLPLASAATSFDLAVEIAVPCRYQLGAALSATSDDPKGSFVSVQVNLTGDAEGPFGGRAASAFSSGPTAASLAVSGVLQPGPVTLHVTLDCNLSSVDTAGRLSFFGGSQAQASWRISLSLSAAEPGDDIRWTKRTGGDFGTASNWDPQQVPVNGAPGADNAIFDLPDTYTVGFGAAQASGRLEVLQGGVTFASADYTVDDLTLVAPSLVVDTGKLTLGSGHLTSNSATIGDLHDTGAEVRVDGATSRWDCLGRLRVGGAGGSSKPGTLTISNGGTMTSVDTRIGAGAPQPGVALISGAGSSWSTDNVQVGSTSPGNLDIEDGGRVTSGLATVGAGLSTGGSPDSEARVIGVAADGTSSEWDTGQLALGQGSIVAVGDGARVNATDVLVGGGGVLIVATADEAHSRASLVASNSLRVATDGAILIGAGGEIEIAVGNAVVGTASGGTGTLSVDGTASLLHVDGQLQIGVGAGSVGSLQATGGGNVTSGTGFVGTDTRETGVVLVDGAASSWAVTGDLFVGGAVADAPGSAGVIVMNGSLVSATGDVSVDETGSLQGSGTLTLGGTLFANGFISPGVSQEVAIVPLSPAKRAFAPRRTPAPPPAGTLTIEGDLVVGPTGVIRAEAAGAQSDRLVVTGTATLDGTLVVQFKNGFAPKKGDQFELFHVDGGVTGAFAAVETRGLAPGAQFDVATTGGVFTVTATNDTVALPTVSVKASAKKLLEKKAKKTKSVLTFARSGPTTAPLTVTYTTRGSATNGLDYVSLPGVVTIPAKKKSVKVTVQLVNDPFRESAETIDVTVVPGADYTESLKSAARIVIADSSPR